MNGTALTVAEFFGSLDSADSRYWPRQADGRAAGNDVERRLDRLLAVRAARALGLDRMPARLEAAERLEGSILLDAWYEQVLMPGVSVAPAEVEAMVARDPGRWKIPERVEFAAVVFPAGMDEDARRFHDEVAGGDPRRWTEEAERAREEDEDVQFIRTSDLLEIGRPPDPVSWTPLLQAAAALPGPGVAEPVVAPELGGTAVVRLILRTPERPVAPEVARAMAEREVRLQKSEQKITELLQSAAREGKARRWPERLEGASR
jgi:hypothetical protein